MQIMHTEDYLPKPAVITRITSENSQIKTFDLVFADEATNRNFQYQPGQFMMVSVPHHGEAPISFSSTPTRPGTIQLSVRRAGSLTGIMHTMRTGERIGLRGPYGVPFPLAALEGRHLLFIAGGIGLAPLRSVINYCLDREAFFPGLTILYGSRLPSDIAFHADLALWRDHPRVACTLTVDAAEPGWEGAVGLVTGLLDDCAHVDPATGTALVCGPPMMIGSTLTELSRRGFSDDHILTTMERHMKCGIGICRHCHMDSKLVCVDGPVFSREQLLRLNVAELRS
jgi:NAD(P)H-flavin reductase